MNKKYFFALLLALGAIVAAVFFALQQGGQFSVLFPAGPIALAERHVMFLTILLSSTVVVPVFFLLFYFSWKYRANAPNTHIHHRPNWDHLTRYAEFAWWMVPSIIVVILGAIMWQSAHALDPYVAIPTQGQTITVDVVALDWKWLFIYPQFNIASVNLLEIPVNTPVHFELTADAPMNSFWIPSLGGQIMVMPGMTTELNLAASKTGDFEGRSANISGEGFAGMSFVTRSVSTEAFNAWVVQVAHDASSTALNTATYSTLAMPSEDAPVTSYASVTPSLFTDIANKAMSGGGMMNMMMPMNTMP